MAVILHTEDLRLTDNAAVQAATQHDSVKPVYVWDDDYLDQYGEAYLEELRLGLSRLNHAYHERGSHLTVIHATLPEAVKQFDEPIYISDHAATTKRANTLDKLRSLANVSVQSHLPLDAHTSTDGDQRIRAYFDAQPEAPPPTLPSNPLPDNYDEATQTPRETLDLTLFSHHADEYLSIVSNPSQAPKKTTRLSAEISTGQLSPRDVHHAIRNKHGDHPVLDRLAWNLRFQQKLRRHPAMNHEALNPWLNDHTPYHDSQRRWKAWAQGRTGHPLVDASMRCLSTTGYLNFRMRALVATYLVHILRQPWWRGAQHMHEQLIDADPAINHYQWQMQSYMIGTHPLRIYNPTKQALNHDEHAAFIKEWVPELQPLPAEHAIEPWDTPVHVQKTRGFTPGDDYPERLVTYDAARRNTAAWFADREPQITKAISHASERALLSESSQERLKQKLDKHANASLDEYT